MSEQLASEAKSLDEKSEAEIKREAKARLKRLSPAAAASVIDDTMGRQVTNSVSGFVTFLRERAVVGLAIGFVIGTQVQTVVKQFISSFVDPLFQLLIPGNEVLSKREWHVGFAGHSASFAWGALVYALLDFLFILITIYVVVKLLRLEQLDKKDK